METLWRMTMKEYPEVLLVDDEPLVLEMFAYALEESGCRISTAVSFEETADLLSRGSFDAAVCDVRLAEQDGFAVADLVKEHYANCAVVMVTGYPELSDKLKALEKGYSFLCKPLNLHTLTLEVHRLIGSQSLPWGEHADHQRSIPQQYLL